MNSIVRLDRRNHFERTCRQPARIDCHNGDGGSNAHHKIRDDHAFALKTGEDGQRIAEFPDSL